MSRLLIVSNRLPITVKSEQGKIRVSESIGGLATGLRGPHQSGESLWVGWPGEVSSQEGQRSDLERELAELRAVPVYLTQSEINRYYEAFSNGVLWPLFHYQTDLIQRDAWRHWETYREVNRHFAEVVAREYRTGDLVWVHDYQLTLVPAMLRRLLPQARIGFFLHIPFPSSEVFRILPWRSQMLEGILGADLIGFHTFSYMRHFARAILLVLGVESEGEMLTFEERKILMGVFPIGVDAAEFGRLADRDSVLAKAEAVRQECGGRKLILGVDRLDYTKGLPRRMLAMDRLLEREPGLRDKVRMIQIVVPSRTRVDSYEHYRQNLDELVGRINGAHATVNSVPIHYLYRSIPQTELVALYRAADLMLVTPLRDGMNLVAKEFVASRTDGDGILMLSEFAGAAEELREAISVNPYDIDGVASTISNSLSLPEEERRARMRVLRSRVLTYDCYHWANSFIKALETAPGVTTQPLEAQSAHARMEAMLEKLSGSERLLLLLDYDGTLVPLASSPPTGRSRPRGEEAAPSPGGAAGHCPPHCQWPSGTRPGKLVGWNAHRTACGTWLLVPPGTGKSLAAQQPGRLQVEGGHSAHSGAVRLLDAGLPDRAKERGPGLALPDGRPRAGQSPCPGSPKSDRGDLAGSVRRNGDGPQSGGGAGPGHPQGHGRPFAGKGGRRKLDHPGGGRRPLRRRAVRGPAARQLCHPRRFRREPGRLQTARSGRGQGVPLPAARSRTPLTIAPRPAKLTGVLPTLHAHDPTARNSFSIVPT